MKEKVSKRNRTLTAKKPSRRSAQFMKSTIKQSPSFVNLEEKELERISSPIASPTRKTLEIDLVQEEIYDCIEFLEHKVLH